MNCREALCLSSLYLCKGIFLKGCSNLIFFRILNSEFSSCQGRAISNIWWNLSLTIWSWLSESQNKSLLLFGKPKVGFYNSFHYVSLSSIKSNRSFFTIHTEFFGFYKNYSLFVDVFFVIPFCQILKLKKIGLLSPVLQKGKTWSNFHSV